MAALGSGRQVLSALVLPVIVAAVLLALPRANAPAPSGTRAIVDEAGRSVQFTPGATRALYMALGAGEYLLTTERAQGLVTSRSPPDERLRDASLLRRAMPSVRDLQLRLSSSEGAAANIETLLLHRPDILLTWSRLVPRFARVGIPAVGLGPISESGRLYEHARFYGVLTDQRARSGTIAAASFAARRAIAAKLAARRAPRTRVLFLYPSGTSWRTNFEFPDVVAAAGGTNCAGRVGDRATLDAERLIAIAPEVIVISGGDQVTDDAALRLMAEPALRTVPAVAARRVYHRPPGVSGYMDSALELPIYQRWLAEVLHPDILAPGTRRLAADTLERALGVVPTEAELDEMLAVRANRGSAHDDRFAGAAR